MEVYAEPDEEMVEEPIVVDLREHAREKIQVLRDYTSDYRDKNHNHSRIYNSLCVRINTVELRIQAKIMGSEEYQSLFAHGERHLFNDWVEEFSRLEKETSE
ncbi:hypothetical protein KW805_00085 [Candidatus Pacearchaeota archaeon]|nr:hypothetical protein [Candidatus Pacearchaeota archaeon]